MVSYNGKHFLMGLPEHRILSYLRDSEELRMNNGLIPKSLNQVILALIENWVSLDPAQRGGIMNIMVNELPDKQTADNFDETKLINQVDKLERVLSSNKSKVEAVDFKRVQNDINNFLSVSGEEITRRGK